MDEEEYLGIWGYTRDGVSNAIKDATVTWDCETCDSQIGQDVTNVFGYYEIYLTALGWQAHEGHDLGGTATHPNYNPAYRSIPDFSYIDIPYGPIDFTLTSK